MEGLTVYISSYSAHSRKSQVDYKQHNTVYKMIHCYYYTNFHVLVMKNCWDRIVEKEVESEQVKILLDFQTKMDKVLTHKIPDITVVDKEKAWIIYVTIP